MASPVMIVFGALAPRARDRLEPLRFDVGLFVDLRDVRRTDEPNDAVHYGEVAERVAAVVRESTLARAGDRVADVVVDRGLSRARGRNTARFE
jgi:dihydroneopterin aldolase